MEREIEREIEADRQITKERIRKDIHLNPPHVCIF